MMKLDGRFPKAAAVTFALILFLAAVGTVMGPISVKSLNSIRFADQYTSIQAAITDLGGAGTVFVPAGTHTGTLTIPSGVCVIGAGNKANGTRLQANANNDVIVTMNGDKSCLRNLWIDGNGKTGVTGISITGASDTKITNVHIDSAATGIGVSNSYFTVFDTVGMLGTTLGWSMSSASNTVNLVNSHYLGPCPSGQALLWYQSSGLSIIGSTFEGCGGMQISSTSTDTWGANIAGNYFENTGTAFDAWITLGTTGSRVARGVSISGNLFNRGANYAVHLAGTQGVEIKGNSIYTGVAAFYYDLAGTSVKHAISFGNNDYNIGGLGYDATKIIAYSGAAANNLNSNETTEVSNPWLLDVVRAPQATHITGSQCWVGNTGATITNTCQLTSTLTTGTAPFAVSSTTVNANLNADLLDGFHAGNNSTGHAMCWKDSTHMGYCSTVVDASGLCTCN